VRTAEEARRIGADAEWMALLQQTEQGEAAQREGLTPEHVRETYTARMIYSLLSLLERRGGDQNVHAHAVSDLATALAIELGLASETVYRIGLAALLHDIGMVAMPDTLLQKRTSLTLQECAWLGEHTVLGAQILESSLFLADLAPAVRYHHEQWDGDGSPDHLRGEEIPQAARIIAVAEAYDSLQRGYSSQAGRASEAALAEVQRYAGTRFDPMVVEMLSKALSNQQGQAIPQGVHLDGLWLARQSEDGKLEQAVG
jgi:putative nucleotidyltransferase with HDIG domain